MACGPRDTLGRPTESVPVWDAASSAGVRPNITVEAPTSRRYEDDPWLSDWTNDAPYYRPGPPCDGYAARIGERTFASLTEAVEEAAPYDVVELCPGEHRDAITIGAARPLEIRGVTGEPLDVLWNIPVRTRARRLHTLARPLPDGEDADRDWIRISGVTLKTETPSPYLGSILVAATRIELRDVVLNVPTLHLTSGLATIAERIGSDGGNPSVIQTQRNGRHPLDPHVTVLRSVAGHANPEAKHAAIGLWIDTYGRGEVVVEDVMLDLYAGAFVAVAGIQGDATPNPNLDLRVDMDDLHLIGAHNRAAEAPPFENGMHVEIRQAGAGGACRADVQISRSSFSGITGTAVTLFFEEVYSIPEVCNVPGATTSWLDHVTFEHNRLALASGFRTNVELRDVDLSRRSNNNDRDVANCEHDYGEIKTGTLRPASSYCPDL